MVFRALDVPANQPVAIKLLRPEYRNAEAAERFVREVKHTAKLVHPNVVRVLDVGKTTEGELYFVMELLEGDSLSAVLRREGHLSVERTVQMAVQVCAALDAAHRAGLVHRDIKPANLVLVPRGQGPELVKVLDFGIARSLDGETQLTGTGLIVGTTEYLAPEQILGQPYDGRADMYALGVTLFRALTGTPLFPQATDSASLLYHQVNARPEPLTQRAPGAQIPAALERVVLRCLRKDPAERFADMAELSAALVAASQGQTTVDDSDLEQVAFRRCAVCEVDNSRFVTECTSCGNSLTTPEQKAYMRRFLAARLEADAVAVAEPAPVRDQRATAVQAPKPVQRAPAPEEAPRPANLAVGPIEHVKVVLRAFDTGIWKRVLAYSLFALALNVFFRLFGDGVSVVLLLAILVSSLALWAHATE